MNGKNAIVLLSGGIDSATCLALACKEGFAAAALTFSYGQRHSVEVERATMIAGQLKAARHRIVALDFASLGGSVLTGPGEVPRDREDPSTGGIPPTYVPARNTVFLAHALAWSEVLPAEAVFIGVNHIDWSGYPDCRPSFIAAMQAVAETGTRQGAEGHPVEIRAPLLRKSKAEIICLAHDLGVDLSLTVSCYDADAEGRACGRCDSCILRKRGFAEAGVADPTRYRSV